MKPDPFKAGLAAARRGDFPTAADLWRGLAEQGDARAQYNLGYLYANGRGVVRDYPAALEWYTRAAEQGFAPAQFNLGVLYSSDDGITPDFAAALKWYRAAAGQGDADSQFNLGIAYALGQGVTQDYAQAYRWYDRAASAGHEKAAKTRDSIAAELTPDQLAQCRQSAGTKQPSGPGVAPAEEPDQEGSASHGHDEAQRFRHAEQSPGEAAKK